MMIILKWIFGKHKCQYANLISDIPMENKTNYLITQCKCGKVSVDRVHRESETYLNQNKEDE